ncbi:MAG TPA: S9 family peptidase [Vicinamibacteria bacterium]|nr:S9 family peptidase [Vicinamibacteria bacterium]
MKLRPASFSSLSLLLAASLRAETPTIDELVSLKSPGEVALSSDGRAIAYVVTETNWEEDRYEREIWIAREGEQPVPFTSAERSSFNPQWSPDSRSIAFLSDRTGKNQVYRMGSDGGEAERLTDAAEGVAAYEWSLDGSYIAFTALDPKAEAIEKREKEMGEFSWEDEDHRMTHLFRLDLEDRRLSRLTEGRDFTVDDFSLSPDGRRLAFSARPFPDPSAALLSDIYVLDLEGGQLRRIVDWPGNDASPEWSPGGDRIAFVTAGGVETYFGNDLIGIVDASGGLPAIITAKFDEDAGLLAWRDEGIYFAASQRTERHLFRVAPDGSGWKRLSSEGWVLGSIAFAARAPEVVVTADRFDRYTEVYRSPLGELALERVTDFDAQLSKFTLSRREVVSWKSKDGASIEGVLVKPHDFDPSRKYPLLFKIHGGPTGVDAQQKITSADRRYYAMERFAAKGALVLMVNYRGSAGYGASFRALNVRNLGIGDAWDVESGLDHLAAQGIVDETRVGTMGWSQGGYISAFLTTHSSSRFRAASVGAGISDWMTYYVNTDIHPFTRQYLKADPWTDPEIYAKTSPITYIQRAQTPTLIQHGEKDARVPIPNAYELYQGLRDRNVPVRLAVYKGFGHGIDKPKSNRAVMTHNEEWFAQWIWGESPRETQPD